MPYCSSERMIQGYDEPEITIGSEEVNDEWDEAEPLVVTVTVNVDTNITWPCAGCGQEAKVGDLSLEEIVEHVCDSGEYTADEIATRGFNLNLEDPEFTESGGGRYKKAMQGCSIEATLTCSLCGGQDHLTLADNMAASYYEAQAH